MADPVSQALQFWGNLDFQRPTRDAQLATWAEALGERKQAFQQGLKTESTLGKFLGDALAPGSALAPTPAPPPSDTGSAQTYPLPSPQPIVGTPQPLVPPGGPSTAPAPGQASTPMQPPNMASLLPQHSQQFLSQQPPQARQAALMALLADMMKKKVTTTAPGAPTGPAPAMGAPAPQGPAGAPSTPPAPAAPAGAPAGWSPMPKPMTGEGVRGADEGGPSVGGRAIDPAKMPSVSTLVQRMKAGGVDPITMYEAVRDYSKMEDQESKKALAAVRAQAEIYRAMTAAGSARLRELQAEDAQKNRAASLDERVRHDKAMEGRAAAGGPTGLSEGAVDLAASQYLATGQMPPLGFSSQALREAILNRAAVLQQEQGTPASQVPGKRAEFKSNQTALTQVTKDLSAIAPYQAMLEKNTGIAIDLAEKIYKANVPLANRSINWLSQNVAGDPDVAEYLAQIRIVQTEAARVLNNPRLVGQLTDSARHEMEGVVNGSMNLSQTKSVLGRLKQDGQNRVNAMQEQSEKLREALGAKSSPASSPASKSPPAAGTIKDGYMFNGGDPSKKENWSKVQ